MLTGTASRSPADTIDVAVLIDSTPQPVYRRADGRLFTAGIPGRPYTLRVRNQTSVRAELIVTVDGRHILKDEPGDPHACHGLVIPPYGTYEFLGWRVSDAESREFLFGEPSASVAAQATGSTANIGVIGFAAWRERDTWPLISHGGGSYGGDNWKGVVTRSAAPVAAAASYNMSAPAGSLGTGIGASREDHVGKTSFTRTTGEPDILVIFYDTETALRERGIIGPPDPVAFPGALTGYQNYTS